jgi:hypothetical protein
MSIAFLQTALNAIVPCLAFFVLNAVLFINSEVTVRVRYITAALVALDFT